MSYETDLEQRNQELEESDYHFQRLFMNQMNQNEEISKRLYFIRDSLVEEDTDSAYRKVEELIGYIAERSYNLGFMTWQRMED